MTPRGGLRNAHDVRQSAAPRAMFAAIARRYDAANTILSAGLHHAWKREAVRMAGLRPGERVLDAGAGTGDLTRLAAQSGCTATAVDVSLEMLAVARVKLGRREAALVAGDLEALPFRDGSFDVALTGFTLRHPTHLDQALRELRRVLAPAGRLVVLEFARPVSPVVRRLYDAYSLVVIPALGGWLTGDADAYRYLVESIRRFVSEEELAARLRDAGFTEVRCRRHTGGIVAIHTGRAA